MGCSSAAYLDGVSVEDKRYGVPRIDELRAVPAEVRFLSIEPLLEDLGKINLDGIHWVIVGGESGHGPRPIREEWVLSLWSSVALRKYRFPSNNGAAFKRSEPGVYFKGSHMMSVPCFAESRSRVQKYGVLLSQSSSETRNGRSVVA
jgi:protein gp37